MLSSVISTLSPNNLVCPSPNIFDKPMPVWPCVGCCIRKMTHVGVFEKLVKQQQKPNLRLILCNKWTVKFSLCFSFSVMLSCWRSSPFRRPSFHYLADQLQKLHKHLDGMMLLQSAIACLLLFYAASESLWINGQSFTVL